MATRLGLFCLFCCFPFLLLAQSKVGDPTKLDSLESLLPTTTEDSTRLQLFYDLMSDYNNVNPRESMRYADSVMAWAERLGNEKRFYQGQYAKGAGYFFLGENDSSEKYVRLALEKALALKIEVDIADAYNLLGATLKAQGEYLNALESFQKGLGLSRNINDTALIYTFLVNMAELYAFQGEVETSKANYEEGLRLILDSEGESFAAAVVYNNLGELDLVEDDTALNYLRRSLKIFTDNGYADGQAHSHTNMGYRYLQKGDLTQSIRQYEAASAIWEKEATNFKPGLVASYTGLADAHAQSSQFTKAREYAEKAIGLGEEFSLKPELKDAYLTRSQVEELAGSPSQALYYLKKGTQLNEELLNEAKTKAMVQSRVRFETEEKEKELAQQKLLLTQQDLEIAQRQNQNTLIIFVAIGLFLGLTVLFFLQRNRQKLKRKETELALQLKQTEAENLRELNQLKSRFFANISHEFRTPLTLILGPLNQLLHQKGNGESQTVFTLMKRNADRLFQLINQLLDLSRLEGGRMPLQLVHADVLPFLKALAGNFESWAASKNLRFHLRFPAEPIVMPFDRDKLEKTVNNLLSNAFKFTPEEGDIWFTVEQENDQLLIQIQDNGIGMNEEQLMRIFDRFYQVESNLYEGSGIGLALVKELVELHQGEIQVSSEVSQGSMFVVSLPIMPTELPVEPLVLEPSAEPKTQSTTSLVPALTPEVSTDKPLLLLVEDNQDVLVYLQSILQSTYRLLTAQNGKQGLALALEHIPDLILSDVMMPEMDGNELAQILKNDQRTSHIPLILLTAKAGMESKLEGLETGADDYLPKPFDERELKVRVQNLIAQRKLLRQQLGKDIVRLSPNEIVVESADKQFLDRVITVIETYMRDETFSIEDLGREVGLSRSQLHRKLKALTDQSPSVFLRMIRLKRAKQLLEEGAGTAAEISYLVGFSSPAYFSKCFKDQFDMTPKEAAM